MKKYTKPALKQQDLVAKLEQRGLVATEVDRQLAFRLVTQLGYYRLTGFCHPFTQRTAHGRKVMRKGTTLDQVHSLYQFDTAIRQHSLAAMASIEIAIATSICDHLCSLHGPHWYLVEDAFSNKSHHDEILVRAFEAMKFDTQKRVGKKGNPNEFLEHYYTTYSEPPSAAAWMLRECASFGFWSKVFSYLPNAVRSDIAKHWQVPFRKPLTAEIFDSWLHALTVFRNNCAHHNRITHRSLRFRPRAPALKEHAVTARMNKNDHNDVHTMLTVIDGLMNFLNEDNDWKEGVRQIFERTSNVNISHATGFADPWAGDPFWQPWPPKKKKKPAEPAHIQVPQDLVAAHINNDQAMPAGASQTVQISHPKEVEQPFAE